MIIHVGEKIICCFLKAYTQWPHYSVVSYMKRASMNYCIQATVAVHLA